MLELVDMVGIAFCEDIDEDDEGAMVEESASRLEERPPARLPALTDRLIMIAVPPGVVGLEIDEVEYEGGVVVPVVVVVMATAVTEEDDGGGGGATTAAAECDRARTRSETSGASR